MTQGQEVAAFWRGYGAKHFPTLANVARAVLGAPGSAAVLERDFGEAVKLVNRQRGSLDASFVEMVMFLQGAYDLIPGDVPALTAPERAEAIPTRLRDPRKKLKIQDLTSGLHEACTDGALGDFLVGGDISDADSSGEVDASSVLNVDGDEHGYVVGGAQGQGDGVVASDTQG